MKAMRRFLWPARAGHLGVLFTLGLGCSSLAQISSGGTDAIAIPASGTIPTVTIKATVPIATWSGRPGVFTIFRAGNPTPALNVYYQIGGTALNGADYQPIGNWVQIPSGVLCGEVVIKPINKGQTTSKTVILTLTNPPVMLPLSIPVNYLIGSPSVATVSIVPGLATNVPPEVAIVAPADGAEFYTPLNLPIVACANDPDGWVTSVEFFANNVSLGIVRTPVSILPATAGPFPPMPPYRPFVLVWSNVPPGTNIVLTAKATDNGGAATLSDPVRVTIHPGPPPQPTNQPPIVRIITPPNGAVFHAPVSIPIFAYAADKDGYVTAVEFFAGPNDLGPGHRVTAVPPPLPPGPIQPPILIVAPTNYWALIWSNALLGAYPLTAVATDNGGLSSVSPPVNVTILPPPPPPPPAPTVVSIMAKDPIAIEGTNCWPWLGLAAAPPAWSNWTSPTAVCRYFTNCGPKIALFEVRRLGPTNADLVVSYDIGGTATSGSEYVPLAGTVTIPAGARVALIPLVPLDDGPPDISSTVILKLATNADYLVGYPSCAAAIILDGPLPSPRASVLPDKCFHLAAAGPDGAWFHVEYTTDLRHWTPICTNQVVNGTIDFIDPEASGDSARFYRVAPEVGAPVN